MAELFGLRGSDSDLRLPQEFVTRRVVGAVQLFGRNRIERIPPDAVILAHRPSTHARMIEVTWNEKRYVVFQRDLEERAEPRNPQQEDPPSDLVASA
jgi:hypothetical protein